MKKIRVAIIGLGRSGRDLHGKMMKLIDDKFELVAATDPIKERRDRAVKEFKCDVYEKYEHIYDRKDIDLVVNTVPSHLHCKISTDIMDHGFHVLCEKPAADSPEEIDIMIESAKRNGKMLAIYHNLRHMPYILKMQEIISSGVLGRIIAVDVKANTFSRRWDWQTILKYSGGNIYNRGSHYIDQVIGMFNIKKMPSVFCMMDRVNSYGDADDYTKIIIKDKDVGLPLIDIELSSCQAYPLYNYNIQGSNGGLLSKTNDKIEWKYYKPEEAPYRELIEEPLNNENGDPSFCREQLKWYEEKWNASDDEKKNFAYAHKRLYNNIYDVLINGAELINTPEISKLQLKIIEECKLQNPQFIYKG